MSVPLPVGLTLRTRTQEVMGKVIASITTSVDGYIVGPKDGPGCGLGVGGERLHYWVIGGPWTYADDGRDTRGMHGADKELFDPLTEDMGRGIVGRNMYEAAGALGGSNPFPGTLIVLTHRTEDQPEASTGFLFIDGFDAALARARELAGDGAVALGGGADLIRQGLAAGIVDELAISTAGAGQRREALRGLRAGPRPRGAGRVELALRHPRALRRTSTRDAVANGQHRRRLRAARGRSRA